MCSKFVPSKLDLLGQIPENGRKMANGQLLFQALKLVPQLLIGFSIQYGPIKCENFVTPRRDMMSCHKR